MKLSLAQEKLRDAASSIFSKLDLPPSDSGHRRVLAVLAYQGS